MLELGFKEIYHLFTGIIEWLDKRAQFVLTPDGSSSALALPMECLATMEIIGNLNETPQLLAKGKA